MRGYDYSLAGAYFVTIVTKGRETLFCEIEEGEMALNALGEVAKREWFRLVELRENILFDASVAPTKGGC